MMTPSIPAATGRGTRSPAESSASPDEYTSMTAPAMSPSTTTIANGMMNHGCVSVTSGPSEYAPIASLSDFEDPASSRPKTSSTTGAAAAPNVVQPTTPRP